jgi:hypothetical protein
MTKRKMKKTLWQASLTASAGEKGQNNGPEETIEPSILTDLSFGKTTEEA